MNTMTTMNKEINPVRNSIYNIVFLSLFCLLLCYWYWTENRSKKQMKNEINELKSLLIKLDTRENARWDKQINEDAPKLLSTILESNEMVMCNQNNNKNEIIQMKFEINDLNNSVNKQQLQHGVIQMLTLETLLIYSVEFPIEFTSIPNVVCSINTNTNTNYNPANATYCEYIIDITTTGFKFKVISNINHQQLLINWIAIVTC